MHPRHLDRLTSVDASFLHQEGPSAHMHIGGVMVFEGPPPSLRELQDHTRARLHLVPRYRQKLAYTALDSGRPVWIDDPSFSVEYHLRHTALPESDWEHLQNLTARIFSQALDRKRPLWEMWLVEGLEQDRFAIISKAHHSLIDGIAGIDIMTALFDLASKPAELSPASRRPWRPHAEPGTAELLGAALRGAIRTEAKLAAGFIDAVSHPDVALARARDALEGVGEIVWALLNPAPASPLNVEIGPYRRFVGIASRLEDFKLVKDTFGGTVNDVVLSVVTGALRTFLISRGVRTEGLELRALVPVSVRTRDERGAAGNRIVAIRGPLPVFIADPLERHRYIAKEMAGLKESKQALGAKVISGAQEFAPPTILAQASRLQFSTRLFNLIITNVPGPQFPLYMRGRQLLQGFPVAFLPEGHALAIAIMSYSGQLNFGLLGDFDAVPDIDHLGDDIAVELATLVALASGAATTALPRASAAAGNGKGRNGSPRRGRAAGGARSSSRAGRGANGARRAPAKSAANGRRGSRAKASGNGARAKPTALDSPTSKP
jgi:diacylglycerol O-acyltransferase / wax synthase